MATLAESFMADLADLSDDSGREDTIADTQMMDIAANTEEKNYDEVGAMTAIVRDDKYQSTMKGVHAQLEEGMRQADEQGRTGENDPVYQLLQQCLELLGKIETEIVNLHNYMKDKYKSKFPELASFVHDPIQYAQSIQLIRNEMDLTKVHLEGILPQHVIMGVTVTATTTEGKALEHDVLQRILEAGRTILQLDDDKELILKVIQNSMHRIAPNLSQAVGESIAAQLIGTAGGLNELARMPACNVQVLGAQRKTLGGFSTANAALHQGFIYACGIMEQCPEELRPKAARLVGAKCTLLARSDAFGSDPSGSAGAAMKDEILQKLEKWQELPPGKTKNVLPVPDLEPKKRRGGKRSRKMKEKYGITDMQKAQNRMKFNEAEEEILDGDEVVGLGMMGKGGIGRLGALQARHTSMKMSNKTQKRVDKQAKRGGITPSMIAGTASTLAFTPVQGIELENPSAKVASDRKSGTETYFSDYGGFKSLHSKPT